MGQNQDDVHEAYWQCPVECDRSTRDVSRQPGRGNAMSMFFGRIFGVNSADASAQATATSSSVNCGPFIGLNWVTIRGGSYTDSYNSDDGPYSRSFAGNHGHVCSDASC